MATINFQFKSLYDFHRAFPTEESCIRFLESVRWPNGVVSPYDPTSKVYVSKAVPGSYRCKNTKKDFNVRKGTIFEGSNVPLDKWFLAIYLITSRKKGESSMQLAKDIDVQQCTAWFMEHRIRETLVYTGGKLTGEVEVDETYVGGKNKNRSNKTKIRMSRGRCHKDKIAVTAAMQRATDDCDGIVVCEVTGDTKAKSLTPFIKKTVDKSATIYMDEHKGYNQVKKLYKHKVVNHGQGQYVDGEAYTNTLEGFWGTSCKRAISGCYHSFSGAHMHRYFNEFAFRHNHRKVKDCERFEVPFQNMEHRLTYKELINEHKERNRLSIAKLAEEDRKLWKAAHAKKEEQRNKRNARRRAAYAAKKAAEETKRKAELEAAKKAGFEAGRQSAQQGQMFHSATAQ